MKSDCAPDATVVVVVVVVAVVGVDIVVLDVVLLEGGGRDRGLKVELGTSFSVNKSYFVTFFRLKKKLDYKLQFIIGKKSKERFHYLPVLTGFQLAFLGTLITTPVCRPSSLTFADLRA